MRVAELLKNSLRQWGIVRHHEISGRAAQSSVVRKSPLSARADQKGPPLRAKPTLEKP
jgi:hypothetical protein